MTLVRWFILVWSKTKVCACHCKTTAKDWCTVLFYTISFKWLLCLFITDWLLSVPSALITSAQGQWQVLLSWNWIPKRLEDTNNVMWWCSSTHTTSTRGFVVCASHPLGNSSSALSYTEVTFKKPLASEILSLLKFSVSLEWVGIFPGTSDLHVMAFSKIRSQYRCLFVCLFISQ